MLDESIVGRISSFILIVTSLYVAVRFVSLLHSLHRNLADAKASGLPYLIFPIYCHSPAWQITSKLVLPVLYQLPSSWTNSWMPFLDANKLWYYGHTPFEKLKSDIIIAVSPQRNTLWTCDPEAIQQISSQRQAFPKPLDIYGALNKFGPTLPGTEGEEWRMLRKVTGRSFHESTNRHVWSYTKDRVCKLKIAWMQDGSSINLFKELARVTFHVISRVCFSKTIEWPSPDLPPEKAPPNHKLSYGTAMNSVFEYLPIYFLAPSWLLRAFPLGIFRTARLALNEWELYVEEMRDERRAALRNDKQLDPDLLTALVEASDEKRISQTALRGNIFIFHAAGYETTGSSLAFALTLLACFPSVQTRLHAELDSLFQQDQDASKSGSDGSHLSYELHFAPLLDGFTGAVVAETLRLFPALSWLPKVCPNDYALLIKDRSHVIPANTLVILAVDATHRNPEYWTREKSVSSPKPRVDKARGIDLLHDFRPDRWLRDKDRLHPPAGTYIPFSAGSRSCIGSRFAQVQMCATLATLLHNCRIELLSPEGTSLSENSSEWELLRNKTLESVEQAVYFEMILKMPVRVPMRLTERREH